MKLYDYLGHYVRVQTKSGETYVGYVEKHYDSKESEDGKEEDICLKQATSLLMQTKLSDLNYG